MAKHSIKTILNTTIGRNIDSKAYTFCDAVEVVNEIYRYSDPENMTNSELETVMQLIIDNYELLHEYRYDVKDLVMILTWSETRYDWIYRVVDFTMKMKSKYPVR